MQELPILILVAAETLTPGLNKQKLPISIFPLCLSAFQVVRCICESGAEMKVAKSPTEFPKLMVRHPIFQIEVKLHFLYIFGQTTNEYVLTKRGDYLF